MKKYFFYTFLLFAGVLISCSNDDSDSIDVSVPFYQRLGVAYDVTNNETRVGANFNKNNNEGVNIKLNEPASILINNKTPDFDNIGVYFYTYTFNGLDKATFTFTRAKDQVFVNVATIEDANPIGIPQSFTSASRSANTTLTWEGAPVGENESVQASITYNGGVTNVYSSEKGSNSIVISFSSSISATEGTLSLSRVKNLPLQQSNGNAGGQLAVSYIQSKEIELN